MLFLAVVSALVLLIVCKIIRVPRHVYVVSSLLVLSEAIGIFPRAFVTSFGVDGFKGPSSPTWISPALIVLMVYNFSFLLGLVFGHVVSLRSGISRAGYLSSVHLPGHSSLLFSSILCAVPGVIVLISGPHHTLLNDTNISVDRVAQAGLGPVILLKEIPLSALVVWYAFKDGKVRVGWWVTMLGLLALSLLGGNRSQTLTFTIFLVALNLLRVRQLRKRTALLLILLGLALTYVGWIVTYARNMLRLQGGSFEMWASLGLQASPFQAFLQLERSSFNGFDGLVSVVGTVPSAFPHFPGRLWYEFATILVPRSIWHSKWTMDLALQFTHSVWGWGPTAGANFLTGPGALYLDSGTFGVFIGSLVFGLVTGFMGKVRIESIRNNNWAMRIVLALWCYFLVRFTYAGGSPDAVMAERVAVEITVIIIVAKVVERMRARVNRSTNSLFPASVQVQIDHTTLHSQ